MPSPRTLPVRSCRRSPSVICLSSGGEYDSSYDTKYEEERAAARRKRQRQRAASLSEDEYEVERIRDHAQLPDGSVWYQIAWKGFSVLDSTWESEEAFDGAEDILRAFRRTRQGQEVPQLRTEAELFGGSSGEDSDSGESCLGNGAVVAEEPRVISPPELSLMASLQQSGQLALAAFAQETEQRWAALPSCDHVAEVVRRETPPGEQEGYVLVRFLSGEHLLIPTRRAHAMLPQRLLRYYEGCLRTLPGAPRLEAYRKRWRREKERQRLERRLARKTTRS